MSPKPILPILELAKEMLDYNPETGVFTWKKAAKNRQRLIGTEAGSEVEGYRVISLNSSLHKAHRLAWAWVNDEEPPAIVDHIDGNKGNNAIENLRDGTEGVNEMNCAFHRGGSLVNVYFDNLKQKWRSRMGDRHLYIGKDFFEAVCARKSAENKFWATV